MYLKYKNYTYIHCFNLHGLPDCQAMSWWRIVPSMVSHLAQVDECLAAPGVGGGDGGFVLIALSFS